MPHALAAHLGLDYLDTTFFAHHPAVLHAFVFAAVTLIVLDRTEYPGAEKSVALRFECAVIYRLRFFHFAVGPLPNPFGRGNHDLDGVEIQRIFRFCEKRVKLFQKNLLAWSKLRWEKHWSGQGSENLRLAHDHTI